MSDIYGLKKRFLATQSAKNVNNIKQFFRNIYSFEMYNNKDLCEFTITEFIEAMKNLLETREVDTLTKDISYVRNYLAQCNGIATLSIDDIDNMIGKNGTKKWLTSLIPEYSTLNTRISYDELVELEDAAKNNLITYQTLASIWLTFIGWTYAEISSLKDANYKDWYNLHFFHYPLPENMLSQINRIFIEDGVLKKDNKPLPYQYSEYLFKSTKASNKKIAASTLDKNFTIVGSILGKVRLRTVNLHKSGMLYFGSLILKDNAIRTTNELIELVYMPLCKRYRENIKSYKYTFDTLFRNENSLEVLYKFYKITIPQFIRLSYGGHTNKRPLLLNPPIRTEQDYRPWEDNKRKGDNGEKVVLNWINERYQSNAYLVNDSEGYDIYSKTSNCTRLIEVKTMHNLDCPINITINEYSSAHKPELKKLYWFYILVWNQKKNDIPILYLFNNLYELLGIENKKQLLFSQRILNYVVYNSFQVKINREIFKKCYKSYELKDFAYVPST